MACCCSCKNLDAKKKVSGKTSGTKYYCKKMKTYVLGNDSACAKYTSSFRKNNDIKKIYDEGKKWSNDTFSVETYLLFLIILIILLIILKITNPNMF